jgi:type VI secretion system protein ImpC
MVEGLPVHTFPTDDGGVDMKCPTEIGITDRREKELADCGFMPISHWKNTDYAVFVGAQSLQKPQEYDNPDATANANLQPDLPLPRAACAFKCMVRDNGFSSRESMETWLNKWIGNFVDSNPTSSEETKARFPLSEAKVEVEEVEGNPGYYASRFYLKPHYKLEGLTVSLRLVSRLPSK